MSPEGRSADTGTWTSALRRSRLWVVHPDERPERETKMEAELEHLLRTYSDHEAISEQGSLRDLLTCLRNLADELELDFEEALREADDAHRKRLLQIFDPCL
jgi:hypothetical protein